MDSTIYIVDDDRAVIESVASLLSTDGYGVRAYGSAKSFLSDVRENDRGCVIADLMIPDMSGFELLSEMNRRALELPVIVISGQGDVQLAVEAMQLGAVEFLEKPFRGDSLLEAIQTALAPKNPDARKNAARIHRERLSKLTKREDEVLNGLLAGYSDKVIAHVLGVSCQTVEVHRANLMEKMQASSLAELVKMSIQ